MGWRAVWPPRRTWWWGRGALCLVWGWLSMLGPRRDPRLPARPEEARGPSAFPPTVPTSQPCRPAAGPPASPSQGPGEPAPLPQVQALFPRALWAGHPGRVRLGDSWTRHLGLQAGQGGLSHQGPAGREGDGKVTLGWWPLQWGKGPLSPRGGGRCERSTLPWPGGCSAPPWGPVTHFPPSPAALWVA